MASAYSATVASSSAARICVPPSCLIALASSIVGGFGVLLSTSSRIFGVGLRMLSDSPGNVGSAARCPDAARLVENGEAVVRRLALLADAHQRRGGACSVARRQRVAVQPGHKIGEASEPRQDAAAGGGRCRGWAAGG